MKTSDYFDQKLKDLGIFIDTQTLTSLIKRNILAQTESLEDMIPLDSLNIRYQASNKPIKDGAVAVFVSDSYTNIAVQDNIVDIEEFDCTDITFVQTKPIAYDASVGIFSLLNAYDPSGDQYLFRYAYVNEDALMNDVYMSAAMQNRVTEEKRGNVTVKRSKILDIVEQGRRLASQAGGEIQEVTMTREAYGQEWGQLGE